MEQLKTYRPRRSLWETWAIFCALTQLAILLALASGGCRPAPPLELTIAAQAAQVREGTRDSIVVEAVPLTDQDLAVLRDLSRLEALLLEHADSQFSASGLKHLAGLINLKHLRIRGRGRGIDDAALQEIAKVRSLRILNLPHTVISDGGLANLADLPALEQLRLSSPHVGLKGIEAIAALPALKRLHLIDIPVGDAGLQTLSTMERLESLYLDGANLSDAAVDELFRARPQLHVHFDQVHHDRDPSRHTHTP